MCPNSRNTCSLFRCCAIPIPTSFPRMLERRYHHVCLVRLAVDIGWSITDSTKPISEARTGQKRSCHFHNELPRFNNCIAGRCFSSHTVPNDGWRKRRRSIVQRLYLVDFQQTTPTSFKQSEAPQEWSQWSNTCMNQSNCSTVPT